MSKSLFKNARNSSSPTYVRPVAVNEKTTLESVVDFVSDVVPQAGSSTDDKEHILWVKFEQLSQPLLPDRCEDKKECAFTTLILIGYVNGVQIWQMHPTGEAQEIISLRQGPVKVFSVIHRFKESDSSLSLSEHLMVSSDESKHSAVPFSYLKITSLLSGDTVWTHSFKSTINDVHSNSKLLLVTVAEKIAAFDLVTLKPSFTLSGCFPNDGPNLNPIALGSSWLAYADAKLIPHIQSQGETHTDTALSYKAAVLNTAMNVAKGMSNIGESLLSNFATPARARKNSPTHGTSGVVAVVDCDRISEHFELSDNYGGNEVICHFHALPHRVANLKFDYSGTLLFCACREGQNFHIYRLLADVCGPKQASVQHLYVLHRGDTTAQVLDVTFSVDSRWVGVCTARGTTHVFPINPYGGKCTARTHTSQYLVNKSTKYEKSAGLEDFLANASSSPAFIESLHPSHLKFNSGALENPRLKNYSEAEVCDPLVQIKQPEWMMQHATHRHIPNKNIAALFVPTQGRTRKHSALGLRTAQPRESLYIVSDSGSLIEYMLEPYCECEQDKIGDSTPLKLGTMARSRWPLNRTHSNKDRKSLIYNHPLGSSPGSETSSTRYGSKESICSDTGSSKSNDFDQPWLAQVEMVTYSGPNRRLWMGPQFKFKTFNNNGIVVSSQSPALIPASSPEVQATSDIICDATDLDSLQINTHCTKPIAMPSGAKQRQASGESLKYRTSSVGDVFLEAGSYEPSPYLTNNETMIFDAFEDAASYPAAEAVTFNLLADAMQDQGASPESLNTRDLMVFPPGS